MTEWAAKREQDSWWFVALPADYPQVLVATEHKLEQAFAGSDYLTALFCLRDLMAIARHIGRYQQALQYAQQAEQCLERLQATSASSMDARHGWAKDYADAATLARANPRVASFLLESVSASDPALPDDALPDGALLRETAANSPELEAALLRLRANFDYLSGQLSWHLGSYPEALEYYLRAYRYHEAEGDSFGQACCMFGVASVHYIQQNYRRAQQMIEQILGSFRQHANSYYVAECLNALAMLHFRQGTLEPALRYAQKSLALSRRNKHREIESKVLHTLGIIHVEKQAYKQAHDFLQRCWQSARQIGANHQLYALTSLAELYAGWHDVPQALDYAQEALRCAVQLEVPYDQAKCHALLARLHKQQGNWQTALEHHEHYHQQDKQVFSERSDLRLQNLELLHHTAQVRQQADAYLLRSTLLEQEIAVRKSTEQALDARVRELTTLNRLSQLLMNSLELQEVLPPVCQALSDIFQASSCGVSLLSEDGQTITVIADYSRDPATPSAVGQSIRLGAEQRQRIASRRTVLMRTQDTLLEEYRAMLRARGLELVVIVALIARERVIGTLGVDSNDSSRHFDEADIRLLETFANYLASAIDNSQLYAAQQQAKAALERKNRELEILSSQDGLTGIANRRFLEQRLQLLFRQAQQQCWPLSVLVCDVDNFKAINDSFSHAVGDEVLRCVALLLRQCSEQEDIVARYGGEEFVVVFPRSSLAAAQERCQHMRRSFASYPWADMGLKAAVTLSMGLASTEPPQVYSNYEQLINRADALMYMAKQSGKDRLFC